MRLRISETLVDEYEARRMAETLEYEHAAANPYAKVLSGAGKIEFTELEVAELRDDAVFQSDPHGPQEDHFGTRMAYLALVRQITKEMIS